MSNKRSESLDEMAISYLMCRDKGHHWMFTTDKALTDTRKRITEVQRFWQCRNCSTEMEETISLPDCDVARRKYIYPDGYLLVKGEVGGHPVRVRDIRREVFSRSGIRFS